MTDELKLVHQQLRETRLKNEQMQVTKDNLIKKLEEQLREKQREISKLSEEVCASYILCGTDIIYAPRMHDLFQIPIWGKLRF